MSLSMRKSLIQEPTGTMYDEQERQKTLRLNRETREPQEPRLEWIYSGDRAQSEDFLLGKKFDADKKANSVAEDITAMPTIDLANKIREDPLYLIKKKEIEQRKKILDNPVRLKQLKELLERQESTKSSSTSSSSRKKTRHSRSRSPDHQRRHRRRSPSPPPPRSGATRRQRTPPRPVKHTEKRSKEEQERRIREMLVDGAIRTEQRQQNVRAYKERDDKEAKVNDLMKQKAKKRNDLSSSEDEELDFIRPMMKQVVDNPSLKRRDLKHHHHNKRR